MRAFLACVVILTACGERKKITQPPVRDRGGEPVSQPVASKAAGPARVTYDHILIAFQGTPGGERARRTRAQAEALAKQIFQKVKDDVSFQDLADLHSDDRDQKTDEPVIRRNVTNYGVKSIPLKEARREIMFPGIGNVVFTLDVGEVALVPYDPTEEYNPYLKKRLPVCRDGWHIVRRVR
ncbi:MAG: peptidylprolyl isomerase [Planctomycetota bacterium]|jgi:hypothetical protein|nr:peptidylprolyl isomerase [Planctomycetota bacterium]